MLGRGEDVVSSARARRSGPAYMTAISSAISATTPRSCVMITTAVSNSPLQPLDQLEDLRLDGHVERRRRLVGDQQLRDRWRAPWRSSRAGACRRRTRAGRSRRAGAARGCRRGPSISTARSHACALDTSRCARTASTICVADLVERVQRRQRVLEDHRDVVAADLAQLVVGRAQQVLAVEQHLAGDARVARAREAHHRQRRHATCPSPTRRRCRASRRARPCRRRRRRPARGRPRCRSET